MADHEWMKGEARPLVDLETDRPHGARVYDALLGGKTNYAADRRAAEQLIRNMPVAKLTAVENRAFMHRAVDHLAGEAGVGQFLDIGTGIPTPPNLHQVAQARRPDARVVYADNDPIVLTHSRALHEGTPEGRTAYVHGDLRDPSSILDAPETRDTLDFTRPIAVTLLTVLHWLPDSADPHAVVRRLLESLPAGSHLVVTHVTRDVDAVSVGAAADGLNAQGADVAPRPRERVLEFFDGLELVDPGLVLVQDWRPAARAAVPALPGGVGTAGTDAVVPVYAGVGRKVRQVY